MTAPRTAIVCHPLADPRTAPPGTPGHLIHEEIPLFEHILRDRGHDVFIVGIGGDAIGALQILAARRPGLVVNLCDELPGGSAGEMHLAGALELLGVPYTGASPLALGLCRDKAKSKQLLRGHGVATPSYVLAQDEGFSLEGLNFPLIAKPASEDGSLGITDSCVAADEAAVRAAVRVLLPRYDPVLVEEYIDGRELNVPLFGGNSPDVLPISEIDFSGLPPGLPRICGYEAKWNEADPRYRGTVGICPAPLEDATLRRIEHWSRLAFRVLGLRDYARVDWRLSPTRGPFFLEANPNPDISPSSGFMRSWRAAGRDYPELVELLVEGALARA